MDVRDTGALAALMRDLGVDAVLHTAALASVPESFERPNDYWSINFDGTRSVVEAMLQSGANRIIFSSTAAVYRHNKDRALREDDPLEPATPYGASKLAAELVIRDYARKYGLRGIAFRYFNAAGADVDGRHGEARSRETHAIPVMMEVALGRRPFFDVYGTALETRDGSCVRDYVSISDLVRAHRQALTAPLDEPYLVCNLGTGSGASVRELLQAGRRVTGQPIAHRDAPPRPGDPPFLVADGARARRVLGWTPSQSQLDSIVASTWKWYRTNPGKYGRRIQDERPCPAQH
jgi:UDP-glucose 4-epimerase